ncbi:unnamed protein product, partial [Vitis vinifera]
MAGSWNKLKKSLSLKLSSHSVPSLPRSPDIPRNDVVRSPSSRSSSSSSSTSRFSRSFSTRSSKKTCAICLGNLKTGQGQAIFTAECSHSFHFNCIASSVRHGNQLCPICRSKWRDVPFQAPANIGDPQCNGMGQAHDEPLVVNSAESTDPTSLVSLSRPQLVTVKALPELPAISASESFRTFAVLVGIKAPALLDDAHLLDRAPIDLVAVLDVSGSMAGSKLSLLKRAVCFLIQNLGPSDRLSIVSFSSTARRIFPLRRMSDNGREAAGLAINSLTSSGGTNIVEGLKKGVRVLEERSEQNPVASIILLSDGKDTYNCDNVNRRQTSHCASSNPRQGRQAIIPVHTFGFGSDHDSTAMHAISDESGGTFSFIESVATVQDAFAMCIGGLLSVVAQELRLTVKSVSPGVHIESIPSGKYLSEICDQGQQGVIDVGDLYAEEGKEFLIYLTVPELSSAEGEERVKRTTLLDVMCSYKDSVSKEVDRQRNRLWVAEGIAEAQRMAETGNLEGAKAVLAHRRSTLLSSASAQAGDGLCNWLESELREIRQRMASMELYEQTGRAYVLSGLSSHSWQRATTRGDSTTQITLMGLRRILTRHAIIFIQFTYLVGEVIISSDYEDVKELHDNWCNFR